MAVADIGAGTGYYARRMAPLVTSMESRNLLQNKKTPELVEKGVSYKIRRLLNIFLHFKQGDYKIMRLLSNRLEL
jgi:protein-L-isoaspartate O-methyltransferase